MKEPKFDGVDDDRIERRRPLRADQIFEVVRREGQEELERPNRSILLSAFAAGLAIGFSVVAQAALKAYLPEGGATPLITKLGYSVGFLLVIIGKLQLFTETTITPVMPICFQPNLRGFAALGRVWSVVFAANMVGAALFGFLIMKTSALIPKVQEAVLAISVEAYAAGAYAAFSGGVGAGFLIAALVWMLANQRGSEFLLITAITYVIGIAGFAHVVAGAVEMAVLVVAGVESLWDVVVDYMLPALAGNVVGGTLLFTLIAYGQIQAEVEERRE